MHISTFSHGNQSMGTIEVMGSYGIGLNIFLIPIKLRPSKLSPYLILIAFLILTKKIIYNFSPC